METWPSLALRLLARMLQQGAHFLERQGQKIEHWAEQVADYEAETSTGEDASSASSGESSHTDRSPGEPPAHWLEKIESSEGPVQWIEHAGEGAPEDLPLASPRSLQAAFPEPFRSRHEGREDPRYPTAGERGERMRTEGEGQHTPPASDEASGRAAPSPRFEKPAEGAARTEADREWQRGAEEAGREQASSSSASTSASEAGPDSASDPEGAPARDSPKSSQPARLQPSPSRNRPGRERETASEHTEPAERTSSVEQTTSDSARKDEHTVSFQSAEAGSRESGVSEAEPQPPPSLPDSREERSDSARWLASEHPTVRASSYSEHVAFGRRHPASSPVPSESSRVERSESSSDVSVASEVTYRSNKPAAPKRKEDIPTARPSRSHWPDLPDVDQIVREDISASRQWERRMRDWERRRRLNREQRGQIWSV